MKNLEHTEVDLHNILTTIDQTNQLKDFKLYLKTQLYTRQKDNNRKSEEFLETLKQKLTLKVHRLKRYKKAQERKNHDTLFAANERLF